MKRETWNSFRRNVEPKFMCLMHSEAKQTETLEFGAKKGQTRSTGVHTQKTRTLQRFSGKSF